MVAKSIAKLLKYPKAKHVTRVVIISRETVVRKHSFYLGFSKYHRVISLLQEAKYIFTKNVASFIHSLNRIVLHSFDAPLMLTT